MGRIWRLLDTGLRPAAQNIAFDRALLEARSADEIPSTLRFLRVDRAVLLGVQQTASHELDLEYCRLRNLPVQRRITAGSAAVVDGAQLGWALYVHLREVDTIDMRALSKRLCHAVATAVSALGVDAHCRRHDEIEIEGRKIGGCSIGVDGDALLLQGGLAIHPQFEQAVQVLRMPREPAAEAASAAMQRETSLAQVLGRAPDAQLLKHNIVEALESAYDCEFSESDVTLTEDARYRSALPSIDTAAWVNLVSQPLSEAPMYEALQRLAAGHLRVNLTCDTRTQTLKRVWFAGDVVFEPRRALVDLEAELCDASLARLGGKVESFFSSRSVRIRGATPRDFVDVIARALRQPLLAPNA